MSGAQEQRKAQKEQMQQQERLQEQQREHQQALQGLNFNSEGQLNASVIREMINTDQLQDETVSVLQKYITRDWVFSNLTPAQEHDLQHKLDVMKLKVFGAHPDSKSLIQGKARQWAFEDTVECLNALTAHERIIIESFFDTLKVRLTRSRKGFERKTMQKQIRESRTETSGQTQSNKSGKLRGLF